MTTVTEPQRRADAQDALPAAILEAFGIEAESAARIATGLINRSWRVRTRAGATGVLQRVNPLFDADVQLDIDAVTAHLARQGVTTPRLLRTHTGALFARDEGQALWRLLSYIDGTSYDQLANAAQAHSAGRVLGQFHAAVATYAGPLHSTRPNVHFLPRHLEFLRDTLARQRAHPRAAAIAALAESIWQAAAELPDYPLGPTRLVHGDPKISNVMFAHGSDEAICLVDLDTLTRMPLVYELADAMRSWTNPELEDAPTPECRIDWFAAACAGDAERAATELDTLRHSLAPATATIAVELAARFCADALNENYFGWDPARFASASAHNEARARSQLALARLVLERRAVLETAIAAALA